MIVHRRGEIPEEETRETRYGAERHRDDVHGAKAIGEGLLQGGDSRSDDEGGHAGDFREGRNIIGGEGADEGGEGGRGEAGLKGCGCDVRGEVFREAGGECGGVDGGEH